jgi:glycosyltransferase involved in cell wall biosynthesis
LSTQEPIISVILPFYNAELFIEEAIESILNQSFLDFELILIDNNSTDNSLLIAEEFQKQDSRIILINEKRQAVTFAFNKGLSISKGDYIVRMDADDISHSDRLQNQYNFLQENKDVEVVSCKVRLKSDIDNNKGFKRYVDWINSVMSYEEIQLAKYIESPIVNPSVMLRKSVFEKYGTYRNGDFPEDYEFWLRLLSKNVIINKLPEYLFTWRDSAGRLTRTNHLYSDERFFKIKIDYLIPDLKEQNKMQAWIWGAGKIARLRTKYLEECGLKILGFIDVDTNKLNKDCIYYKIIQKEKQKFILSLVSNTEANKHIKDYLISKLYEEGKDFLLLS